MEERFEIKSTGKGQNFDYLEERGHVFLSLREPYVEVKPIGYKSTQSCSWSTNQAFIRTCLDDKIIVTIRDGKLYLVRKEFKEDFNKSFAKNTGRKSKIVKPEVEVKAELIIKEPVEKTNREILKSLRELWKVGYDNGLIEERNIKGRFYETLIDIISPLNTRTALKNFEDYMCLVFSNTNTHSDTDLDYVLTYAVNKKLKEL